ncbi:lipase family protein [Streptomyces violens]|uniref:lipase family protein n=1 Tax=Streptomyces violens TaxID=66377 RepID=UPI001B808463|nr:lipase family protein [Streptomyces violens]
MLHTPMPGVKATKVVYRSTNARGEANTVSGTVLVPAAPWLGKRPVVGYAVGTHGLGDAFAPSQEMSNGTETEASMVSGLLGRGWAVAVTDYEGLGTPGQHTYMVGPAMGHAVLDVLRAATRLPGGSLAADAPMAVWGYSQGGAAAAWAAQLHPSYAPELPLVGVAAGGVPADVLAVARHLDGGAFFGLAVAALIGLDAAHPELDLNGYLNDVGRQLLQDNKDDSLIGLVTGFALKNLADITTTNPLEAADWQDRFAHSRLGATAPSVPVLLYHGELDEIIPYGLGTALRDRYCAHGVPVQWQSFPATDHITGVLLAAAPATDWLATRFHGRPPLTTCP